MPATTLEVVRDQDDRHAVLDLQRLHQLDDLRLDGDVERGRRLVRDQQLRVERQRHGDHRPLSHSAGELVGIVVDSALRPRDPDPAQKLDGASLGRHACRDRLVRTDRLDDLPADPVVRDGGSTVDPGRSARSRRRGGGAAPPASMCSRSRPSKDARPEIRAPCVRPDDRLSGDALARARFADDPERLAARSTPNERPRTAWTSPSAVANDTARSRTSSSGIREATRCGECHADHVKHARACRIRRPLSGRLRIRELRRRRRGYGCSHTCVASQLRERKRKTQFWTFDGVEHRPLLDLDGDRRPRRS